MRNLVVSVLISALVAFGVVKGMGVGSMVASKPQETAYQRVLRTGELRCGYVNWSPYFILDPNDPSRKSGLNVEITNEIGRLLDLKIVWAEEVGWGNLAEGLLTGRYDAVCSSLWPDAPKIKNLALSDALFFDPIYPYVRADETRFSRADSLNAPSVRVAAVEGGTSSEMARQLLPRARIVSVPPQALTGDFFLVVATRKADVMLTSPSEFADFDRNNPGKLTRLKDAPFLRLLSTHMAFGPDGGPLRDRVNAALQIMVDNGDMARIVQKYSADYILRRPLAGEPGGAERQAAGRK